MRNWYRVLPLLVAVGTSGCASIAYYTQSAEGELAILSAREPIAQVIDSPHTSPALRHKLERVLAMRHFASAVLDLPDNQSYRSYADLHRNYVVWTVVAAPPFSLQPVTWCFPFAGCVAYRGYFQRSTAEAFARTLRREGDDVRVHGVVAYSTLGWFADPLPSTVIDYPDFVIAGLIFHELAHQELYIENDSAFDEAFAVTVQQGGVERWLAVHGTAAQRAEYALFRQRQREFLQLVEQTRARLKRLYASGADRAIKRRDKARIFQRLREDYEQVRSHWKSGPNYDAWFAHTLNNASIVSVATYHRLVPAFEHLLEAEGGDFKAFYAACRRIAKLPPAERKARLQEVASGGRERTTAARSGTNGDELRGARRG